MRIFSSKWNVNLTMILLACLSMGFIGPAQELNPKFQSVFIFGIARKVDWPSSASKFRIGIIGKNKALATELSKLAAAKTLDEKSVSVDELSSVASVGGQDIIFYAGEDASVLSQILAKAGNNSMVMSAYTGALDDGAHLNFVLDGNKITFEINKTSLSYTNIKVSDALISLAGKVQ